MSLNKVVASATLDGVNTQAHQLIKPEVAEVTSPGEAERLMELRRHGISDGHVVSANRVSETMFEFESNQSIGKSIAGLISGEDAVAGDGVWTRSVYGNGSRKDATKFPIEVSRTRWTDAEGSTASDALGRASGRIAHKLNNLMQPIIGLTQLELDQLPDEGTAEQMDSRGNLTMILESSRQTIEVIRKVLMFARGSKPALTPVDLPAALNRAITSFGKLLPRGVHVEQFIDAAAVGVATINDTE